jgi:hypothetical protein
MSDNDYIRKIQITLIKIVVRIPNNLLHSTFASALPGLAISSRMDLCSVRTHHVKQYGTWSDQKTTCFSHYVLCDYSTSDTSKFG